MLGETMDNRSQESRNAVSVLLTQYALNPRPGAIADAIVMFLERSVKANSDNAFVNAQPVPTVDKTP